MNTNATEKNLTGYPSIDKPWMSHYPGDLIPPRKKFDRILDKLKDVWTNPDEAIINYYDSEIKVGDFFHRVDEVAKALTALGMKCGDSIVASLESVPEYIELLLACEIIGCSIKNYLGKAEQIISLINADDAVKLYIAPDYLSAADAASIYTSTSIKSIIVVDPLFSVQDKDSLRNNIAEVINSKYSAENTDDTRNISWDDFLAKGRNVDPIIVNNKNSIRLFSAFTSGSTGETKEVIHSSESVLGIVNQLTLFPFHEKCEDTWLNTMAPPFHATVVISLMCYPLADRKKLILDPYCKIEDLDIEIMHYKPTCWGAPPVFFNSLIESNRIPKDYDMSFFKLIGFGAEPITKKFAEDVQNFLEGHNCTAQFSTSYGQSEGGTGFTTTFGKEMVMSGSYGIPYLDTTISIFEPRTTNELKYYEIGEICKCGPGIMLGYPDQKLTDKVLKNHPDGNLWLHTGDFGYMTEQGLLYVLGRNPINVYPNNPVFPLAVANKLSIAEGVKDLVIVAGKDPIHNGFEAPYLFIVPEKDQDIQKILSGLNELIIHELLPEEKPVKTFVIDKKPMKHFKTDIRFLQEKYNLF